MWGHDVPFDRDERFASNLKTLLRSTQRNAEMKARSEKRSVEDPSCGVTDGAGQIPDAP